MILVPIHCSRGGLIHIQIHGYENRFRSCFQRALQPSSSLSIVFEVVYVGAIRLPIPFRASGALDYTQREYYRCLPTGSAGLASFCFYCYQLLTHYGPYLSRYHHPRLSQQSLKRMFLLLSSFRRSNCLTLGERGYYPFGFLPLDYCRVTIGATLSWHQYYY